MGIKVVLPQEAASIDRLAIESGESEKAFIEKAGKEVFLAAKKFFPKKVALLVGKGNKGADGYAASLHFLEEGVEVIAFSPFAFEEALPTHQFFRKKFLEKGGLFVQKSPDFSSVDLIIDALFGTGFQKEVTGQSKTFIELANSSQKPIIAIDIPSGLDGATGKVKGLSIRANLTISLGFAKLGFFLRDGWDHVGEVVVKDFGLPSFFYEKASALAHLACEEMIQLPLLHRSQHKYEAGYLVGFSGSQKMRGAPKLAALAALRSGAGIVRVFHLDEIGETPFEVIAEQWDFERFKEELKRASAFFIGPGIGMQERLDWLQDVQCPIVVDADALRKDLSYPKDAILTPHRGEVKRLLGLETLPEEEILWEMCQQFTEKHHLHLLFKGAPSLLFSYGKKPLILPWGDPGMATAGSGDVLTGMIGAFLAKKIDPYKAALLGAFFHGKAGEKARKTRSSYSLIASDLIDSLAIAPIAAQI